MRGPRPWPSSCAAESKESRKEGEGRGGREGEPLNLERRGGEGAGAAGSNERRGGEGAGVGLREGVRGRRNPCSTFIYDE